MRNVDSAINSEAAGNAATRAEMFGFMAAMLNRKPGAELVQKLRAVGSESFAGLIPDEDHSTAFGRGLLDMSQFVEEASGLAEDDVVKALAIDWTRLFRGVSPGYGPPPPYESVYLDQDKSDIEIIQKVGRWYVENGVKIDRHQPNRPDFLGIQIDFLRHLAEQEQDAWKYGNSDDAMDCLNKSSCFVSEHMASWVHKFCRQAMDYAETGFYKGVIRIIEEVFSGDKVLEKI